MGKSYGVGFLAQRRFRREIAARPKDAPYAEWGRWILADRATRPIGPGLTITRAEAEKLATGMAEESAATPATSAPVAKPRP